MCLHSKLHRSMLLVSLQYSMFRVTNFKVHYATLLLLMWQSALCYTGPSSVLHSKMQSSMALVVVYHAMFSRPNVLF